MNLDFKLKEESRFNARCQAVIYNKDKTKVLLFKVLDGRNFYMLPGGRIKYFEDSKSAIKREIEEETGYKIDFKLISIQENFLTKNDIKIMQYAFCYKGTYNGVTKDSFMCKDNDNQCFYWIDIDKLDGYKILPTFTIDLIKDNNYIFLHNIENRKD